MAGPLIAGTPESDSGLPEQLVAIDESIATRADHFDESVLSRGLEWAQIQAIAAYWQVCRVDAGSVMLPEGWRTPFMAIVISGEGRARKLDSDQTERELAHFAKGRIFGELAIMDGEPASASVVADSDTVLLVLTAAEFEKLRADHPASSLTMVMTLARLISQRLRSTSGRLVDLL